MTDLQAIQILDEAIKLLADPHHWTKEEDFGEECTAGQTIFSLACALKIAHEKVVGAFESRSMVMKKLRGKIRQHFLWRHGIHPIYSFNKHKKTTHFELMFLLHNTRKAFT